MQDKYDERIVIDIGKQQGLRCKRTIRENHFQFGKYYGIGLQTCGPQLYPGVHNEL